MSPFILIVSAIVLPIFAVFCVWAVVGNYLFEHRLQSRMRRCGRLLRWKNALGRISTEGGTLIIENPSLGWNFTHAWWTPENLPEDSPFSEPNDDEYQQAVEDWCCLDWDKWCWDRYTCPENGRALLLRVWNGASLERKLRLLIPDIQVVRTWTALVHYPRLSGDSDNDET